MKAELTQAAHDGRFSTAELIRMERLTARQVAMWRANDRLQVVRLAITDHRVVLGRIEAVLGAESLTAKIVERQPQ